MTNDKPKKNFIEKFQNFMEEKILPGATKFGNQRHMASIRDGMTLLIPLTIIGGIAMVIAIPPVPAGMKGTNFFFSFLLAWQAWAKSIQAILMVPYNLTIGIISIYVVAGVSYQLAHSYKMNALNNAISALFVFLAVSAYPKNDGAFSVAQLGASSMFTAMIVGIAVVEINRLFIKKNISIKMPDSVPPNVAAPFNILLPLTFNIIFFIILNQICFATIGGGLTLLIYKCFQPLLSVADSLPSILVINFLMTTFWFFGIHGANMVSVVTAPITTAALALNAQLYAQGKPLTAIYAGAVNAVFGNWITYTAILIVMLAFCKASQIRSVAKVALVPTIFNINEPMIFGIPTVLNIFTYIPLVICSMVNFSTAYVLMKANILGKFFVTLPFTVPGPLQAFLSTMDWKTIPLWFALLFLDCFIVYPFIKTYDKQLLKQEKLELEEN